MMQQGKSRVLTCATGKGPVEGRRKKRQIPRRLQSDLLDAKYVYGVGYAENVETADGQ